MIYIYCPRTSLSARALVTEISALGRKAEVIRTRGPYFTKPVVNWGSRSGVAAALNANLVRTKLEELFRLREADVRCVRAVRFPHEGAIMRAMRHHGALDLLHPERIRGEVYYTTFTKLVNEFRLHVFGNRIIRAALKVPRTPKHHPWIRSYRAGWKFNYGRDCQAYLTDAVRAEARKAIYVLKYDFGAVDIGIKNDGEPVVLEVNSAPGFRGTEHTTARKYAENIIKWAVNRESNARGD